MSLFVYFEGIKVKGRGIEWLGVNGRGVRIIKLFLMIFVVGLNYIEKGIFSRG